MATTKKTVRTAATKKKTATKKSTTTKGATKKKTSDKPPSAKSLDLFDGEKFPAILLSSIEVVERPKKGQKKIFFNPREPASFDPVKMASLLRSIRLDGLLEPIVVAVFTTARQAIQSVNLIAGERRYRSLCKAVSENLPCYDSTLVPPDKYRANAIVIHGDRFAQVVSHKAAVVEIKYFDDNDKITTESSTVDASQLSPTASAKQVFATVPCKVFYNPPEQRMMRIAVTENKESEPLTTHEEVLACERLSVLECKQEEIAYMLAQNVTWVSQTLSFRHQLPADCFEALVEGRMKRNVAVNFLSYAEKDRQKLFESTVLAEEKETADRIAAHEEEQNRLLDEADIHETDAEQAEVAGNEQKAKKARRKAAAAERKAKQEADKKRRAESDKGNIRQGHVNKGAAAAGVSPRKAKMLSRPEVEEAYVTQLEALLDGETTDPICQEEIPGYAVDLVRKTAQAILSGERDPLKVIRSHMVEQGEWDIPDKDPDAEYDDEDYVPDESDLDEADDAFGELGDDDWEDRDIDAELEAMGVEDD